MMMGDLFGDADRVGPPREQLGPGAVLLRGWALPLEVPLLAAIDEVVARAPFRRMITPGGFEMSAAMTNCGRAGWVSDRTGYRYDPMDPESGRPWPEMPDVFRKLALDAAAEAGYPGFLPDACLVNHYEPGARLSLHQDKNERDFGRPIVSVSLGLPAIFQFGGARRTDTPRRIPLHHGDVAVWGGPSRLFHHGILALKDGHHPTVGGRRLNLTLRMAL